MKRSRYTLLLALTVIAIPVTAIAAVAQTTTAGSKTKMMKQERMAEKPAVSRAYLHNYNLPSSGVALEGYCPVCYIAANKAVLGKAKIQADYNGVTYYFVSEDAKRMFEKNPQQYLPAYGGWCATGMALKDKFPVDPRNFKVVNGRLFLFLTNKNVDAQKLWNQGSEQQQIAKADAHWKTINQ